MTIPGFTPTFLYLMAGLIIWFARFIALYGFTGLVCARPAWNTEFFGIGVLTIGIVSITMLALAANGAVFQRAWARLNESPSEGTENARFVHYVAAAMAALGTLAIVWETRPVFIIPACV